MSTQQEHTNRATAPAEIPAESPESAITERRRRTRERLLTAAQRVFAQRGIAGASVEEICEEADFTRGAFYSNFGSKDELIEAVFLRICEQIQQRVVDAATSYPEIADGEERLRRCVAELASAVPRERTLLLTFKELQLYAIKVPSLREVLVTYQDTEMGRIYEVARAFVAECGRTFTLPAETSLDLLAAAYEFAVQRALETADPQDPEVVFDLSLLADLLIAITRPTGED